MKEQAEKQVNYTALELPELLGLAMSGDKIAAAEIIRRQDAQKAEIESLRVRASKARKEKAEKTPLELAKDNAYFRTALLVKQFGQESVNLQVLTAASAFLECGLAQGNLRQAFNRVDQIIKAQAVTDPVFPDWIMQAAKEIPVLDENRKLEEEIDKVEEIKAVIQKYMEAPAQEPAAAQEAPAPEAPAPEAPAAPSKKGGKK